MASTLDSSIGFKAETTYGTAVTVDKFLEFTSESLDFKKTVKQGEGLRVGRRVPVSARRVVPEVSPEGDIEVQLLTKGQGALWQAALGAGTSTMVETGCYQQVFSLADDSPFYTVQKGLPSVAADGAVTVRALTFKGMQVDSWEFDQKRSDIPTLKTSWIGKDVDDTIAYAAPSYVTGANVWSFASAALYNGTYTAPTTTALGTASTAIAQCTDVTISCKNNLANDRYVVGGAGRRLRATTGLREITGKMTVEFNDLAWTDAVLADSALTLVITYLGATLGAASKETLQVCIPCLKIDSELPKSNAGKIITQGLSFAVLDNLTNPPIQVVVRTAETTI